MLKFCTLGWNSFQLLEAKIDARGDTAYAPEQVGHTIAAKHGSDWARARAL